MMVMMKKLFSRFTELEFIVGCLIVILVSSLFAVGYSMYLYRVVMDDKESGMATAETSAIENSSLSEVKAIERYHGSDLYFSIEGITDKGEEAIVFVSGSNKEPAEVTTFLLKDLLSKDEMISSWRQQCNACSLIDYNWAIENKTPLLEVTYISENNRYVMEYFALEDGTTYQRLPLKRTIY